MRPEQAETRAAKIPAKISKARACSQECAHSNAPTTRLKRGSEDSRRRHGIPNYRTDRMLVLLAASNETTGQLSGRFRFQISVTLWYYFAALAFNPFERQCQARLITIRCIFMQHVSW